MSSTTSFLEKVSRPDSTEPLNDKLPIVSEVKVFINQINSYHGSVISRALRNVEKIPENIENELEDITEDGNDVDEETKNEQPDAQQRQLSVKYLITGTFDSKKLTKSEFFVDEVVDKDLDNLEEVLLDQDYIVYDLNFDVNVLDEVFTYLQVLENTFQNEDPERIRHLIIISNPMTWGRTK